MLCQFHYCHVITIFDPCIDDRRYISVFIEEFEDIKSVTRNRKAKKGRQLNGQKKKLRKEKNNDLQNTKLSNMNPTKNGGELRCVGSVSSSCSTCGTSRVTLCF